MMFWLDLFGIVCVTIGCLGLLALSNGLIVPQHTEQPTQEAEEEVHV